MQPSSNELEVSIFSRGSGEAAAVHVGGGRWLLIDSLLSEDKTPVSLDYLEDIGVPFDAVDAVLLTHWHDDHIAGASKIAELCHAAVIAIPVTLQNDEFLAFIDRVEPSGSATFSSGVVELQGVLQAIESRNAYPHWSLAQRRISGGPGCHYDFEALSPSNADVCDFMESIPAWLKVQAVGGRLSAPTRNHSSVAAVVAAGEHLLLFGADLEVQGVDSGWAAVQNGAWQNRGKASFLKIPHHGSKNAHYEPMWSEMAVTGVYSVLTPWNKNKGLPTVEDVKRIISITPNAYSASRPLARKAIRRMAAVDRALRDKGIQLFRSSSDTGHVRFRCLREGGTSWVVELLGVGSAPLADLAA